MARVSGVTVAALATAAVAVAGVGAYALSRRRCAARRPPPDLRTPAPQATSVEPPEGYEARWEAQGPGSLESCIADPEVLSFAQAVTCALNRAYPEGAPWTDPAVWSPWMQSAGALVEAELEAAASAASGNPRAWEIAVWLRGRAEIDACRAASGARGRLPRIVALCAAQRIYPGAAWDRPRAPWQTAMVGALAELAEGPS